VSIQATYPENFIEITYMVQQIQHYGHRAASSTATVLLAGGSSRAMLASARSLVNSFYELFMTAKKESWTNKV